MPSGLLLLAVELVGRYSKQSAYLLPVTRLTRLLAVEKRPTECNDSPVVQAHKLAHRFTPEQLGELVAAYEAGATPAELGRQYGISHTGIPRLLERLGVTLRKRGLSDDELVEATRLYESGLSLVRIGSKLSKDPSTVRNYLRRAGVKMRDTSGR
ncbi:helix-turn-helix domain-containing protein [Kribbella sp. NPDC056345]|uniref:helix-turn-helix domain-containing protein n=1 Tax=Kribbella sp. NPDC056345 TaxID=3345789 RepID=UPI0035DD3014